MTDKRKALPKLLSLYAFEATARLGTVSLAAEELCLTQGAVSRQLQSLEILLGLRLFARSRNRMILTEVGTTYLADVRAALGALSDATDAVTGSRGGGGTLRLATLPTFGARWLMPRLPRFCNDHPHVAVHVITRLAPFDFSLEQLDGAIHFGGREWSGAVTDRLLTEELVAVAAPPLAKLCKAPRDILELPKVQITSRAFSWRTWLSAAGMAGETITPSLVVETFAMGIEAVLAGIGVGIVPALFVDKELADGTLSMVGPRVESDGAYYFAYPERRKSHYPLREFVRWIRSESSR